MAHGSSGDRLFLELDGDTLHLRATPSVAAFAAFDRDHDGRLTKAEVKGKRDAMVGHFLSLLQLRDDRGRAGEVVFSDLNPLHAHARKRKGKHLRITLRLRFVGPPKSLWLAYSAGETAPMQLLAARAHRSGDKRRQVQTARLRTNDVALTLLSTTEKEKR